MPNEFRLAWGFDPGFTTGWALVNWDDGESLDEGTVSFGLMADWLIDRERMLHDQTRVIVVEDFALRGGKEKAQIGSHFETVQVIGMLRLWAARAGMSIHLQAPSIKPIAQRYTGRVPKGAHSKSHSVDAYNHVEYYLHGIGHYETRLERELREAP
jgi:hypothetical protein